MKAKKILPTTVLLKTNLTETQFRHIHIPGEFTKEEKDKLAGEDESIVLPSSSISN